MNHLCPKMQRFVIFFADTEMNRVVLKQTISIRDINNVFMSLLQSSSKDYGGANRKSSSMLKILMETVNVKHMSHIAMLEYEHKQFYTFINYLHVPQLINGCYGRKKFVGKEKREN